jgi:hypothetical protein
MKIKRLVHWKELKALDVIERALSQTPYRVCPTVRLSEVLEQEPGDRFVPGDKNFLMTSHFDFVVCRRRDTWPLFAIELDGPSHQTKQQVERDVRKNRLCARVRFPLLRIGYAELDTHEQITLLEFMLQRFVAWQQKHEKIQAEIGDYLASLTPAERERLFEDGIADPSVDPTFSFNLQHRFPGITQVSHRLLEHFNIVTPYHPLDLSHRINLQPQVLTCDIMPAGENYLGNHRVVKRFSYTVYRQDPDIKVLQWKGGKLITPGIEILNEGEVEFTMQWTLPVVDDYIFDQNFFDYFDRTGNLPYSFIDIPGIHIPDIAEWFTEYLALRKIEKWAEKFLLRRSFVKDSTSHR